LQKKIKKMFTHKTIITAGWVMAIACFLGLIISMVIENTTGIIGALMLAIIPVTILIIEYYMLRWEKQLNQKYSNRLKRECNKA
jgi:c-di-AMP phosphodiesterase-like protein